MSEKHPVVFGMRPLWPGQLARVQMHQTRTGGDLSHVNAERTHLNEFIIGGEDWKEVVLEDLRRASELNLRHSYHARRWVRKRKKEADEIKRLGPQDPWKSDRSEGPMREGVLTANAKYFEGDMPGFGCPEKILAFRNRGKKFLFDQYGPACVAAWEDQDEEAFHIHFIVVPMVKSESKNSGKQRVLVPSSVAVIKSYEHGHDVAAEYFKDIGLVRGQERAKRRRAALESEQECELPAGNTPCHIWRAEEAVRLDKKRLEVQQAMHHLATERANLATEMTQKATADEARREKKFAAKEASLEASMRAEQEARDRAHQRRVDDLARRHQERILAAEAVEKANAEKAAIVIEAAKKVQADREAVAAREVEIEWKIGWMNETLRHMQILGDQIRAAAIRLDLMKDPIVGLSMKAVNRIKSFAGYDRKDQFRRALGLGFRGD